MNKDTVGISDNFHAGATRNAKIGDSAAIAGRFDVVCFDRHGNVKWEERIDNLVVTTGRNDLLNKYFKGSSYTSAHYFGLIADNPTIDASDTMASHAGWTELTDYDETDRVPVVWGSVSSGSLTSAVAEFTISDTVTIAGAFVATDDTKGGSSGILYAAGAFLADKGLDDDDVLKVTYQANLATP